MYSLFVCGWSTMVKCPPMEDVGRWRSPLDNWRFNCMCTCIYITLHFSDKNIPGWTVSTRSHSIWACSSVVGGEGNFRIPAGMLSLSDRLLRLPGRTCPVVGLTDAASCSESLGASGLGEYLLISDALDLQKVISYLILIHKYRIYLHKYVAKSNLTIKLWLVLHVYKEWETWGSYG